MLISYNLPHSPRACVLNTKNTCFLEEFDNRTQLIDYLRPNQHRVFLRSDPSIIKEAISRSIFYEC